MDQETTPGPRLIGHQTTARLYSVLYRTPKKGEKMFGTLSDTKELYKTHFILYWIPKKWTRKLLQVHA